MYQFIGNGLNIDNLFYKNTQPGTVVSISDIKYKINNSKTTLSAKKSILLILYYLSINFRFFIL